MSTAIYQYLAGEPEVSIKVDRARSGGEGFVLELDAPQRAGAQLTIFMTREQLVALLAATSVALARPDLVVLNDSVNGREP